MIKTINLKTIKLNPHNPRVLRDKQYEALVESIKRDPQFLDKRGIVHMVHFPGQEGKEVRGACEFMQITKGKCSPSEYLKQKGIKYKTLPGFQLRYIYFLDPAYRERLTVPILPFSKIDEMGAATSRERAVQVRPPRSKNLR